MRSDKTAEFVGALATIVCRRHESHCVVERAKLVKRYLELGSARATANELGCTRKTVMRWVLRWEAKPEVKSLRDLPRAGRPRQFNLEASAKVLSIASQEPSAYGFVTVGWTQETIVEALVDEGVVMSRSTAQRILANQRIDVRRVKYWLFTPTDRAEFVSRRDAICKLYLGMAELPSDEIVICMDAKPGIQLLADPKNKGGRLGAAPGFLRRVEFEYKRLGTRGLVAAVRPDTGELVYYDVYHKERRFDSAATIDFLEALRKTLKAQGYRRIHLVVDNGSTHTSKATTAFLREHSDTFSTYFTPVHASWLNLCENFFSTFSRRYLRHRRYTAVSDFMEALPLWVEDHNWRCNPLRWRYAPWELAA